MIDKADFHNELYKKIVTAMRRCDENNVIDLRLSLNDNPYCEIYSIFEFNELYEKIKNEKSWFIDFFENINGENTAEFMDIALFASDCIKEEKPSVWCVLISQVADHQELRNDVRIFAKKEDAMDYAKAFVADEMEYVEREGWNVDDDLDDIENGSWCAYEDGYYSANHTTLYLTKEEIIENNQ